MPATPSCTCISCTSAFGQQLANVLHTWAAFSSQMEEELAGMLCLIQANASALSQLQAFLGVDEGRGACSAAASSRSSSSSSIIPEVFTPAGREEIEALGIKCGLIFKAIILIFQRASERNQSSGRDSDSDEDSDQEEGAEDDSGDAASGLLVGPVPDLSSIKTLGLVSKLRGQRRWLENRLECCHTQLRWVNKGLLLHLHMAKLAQLHNDTIQRQNGAFESEVTIRSVLYYLRGSQVKVAKEEAKKQQKKQRREERRRESLGREQEEDDNASTTSSDTSGQTIVGETPAATHNPPREAVPPPNPVDIVQPRDGVPVKRAPGIQSVSPPEPNVVTHAEEGEPDKSVNLGARMSSALGQASQKLSDTMAEWTHRIFGKEDEFSRDWPSDELEAWVTRGRPRCEPIKIPFGHRRLHAGLKKIKGAGKNTKSSTFGRYIAGGPRTQLIIDDVVHAANRLQSRERVCLAFQEFLRDDEADSFTIVFFSIQKEKAPILLTDAIGRRMSIPFEVFKEWRNVKGLVMDLFVYVTGVGPHVMEGHYDFFNAKGENLLPHLWTNSVKPGDSITMKLWPIGLNPLRRVHPESPPYGRPTCTYLAEDNDREARATRLQSLLDDITQNQPGRPPLPSRLGYSAKYPHGTRLVRRPGPPPAPLGMRRPPVMELGRLPPPMPPPMPPPPMRMPMPPGPRRLGSMSIPGPPPPPPPPHRRPQPMRWFHRRRPYEMRPAEEKELSFVDFVGEVAKAKDTTVASLLTRCTGLADVTGEECLDAWHNCDSGSDSDSDSDSGSESDSSGSSGTSTILCD